MNDLFHFLTDFAVNPKQQLTFVNAPQAVTIAAGLSPAAQAVVESKSYQRVAEAFSSELTRASLICGDPGPDPTPDPDLPWDDDDDDEDDK